MLPFKSARFSVKIFHQKNGKAPFLIWMDELDLSIRARIVRHISRFAEGNFGDHQFLGDGVYEARFFFGSGYRVYFSSVGEEVVLLLLGGDKSSQAKDIDLAKAFLKLFLEEPHANEDN